jgi:amyloid beta precursor protein binding protein 1
VEQLCLRSVDAFRAENNGLPPLSGPIPDMHADTNSFVALQRLYRDKALSDLQGVQTHFASLVKDTFSRAPSQEDLQLLTLVCKHVGDVRHVSTKSLADELIQPNLAECAFEGLMEIDEPKLKPQAPVCWYAGLRAVDRFYVKQGRYPGLDESSLAADASLLADELRAFVQEAGAAEAMNEALADAHAQELARFGASELHGVASVVGGVASQEAVKVIARQYEPVDHTYVFNGIAGVGGVVAV